MHGDNAKPKNLPCNDSKVISKYPWNDPKPRRQLIMT
jgi:hypothetical protein